MCRILLCDKTRRDIFICFKEHPAQDGRVIYGAAISRLPDDHPPLSEEMVNLHYKTALARMDKSPVILRVPEEFVYQLSASAFGHHQEDIVTLLAQNVMNRVGGRLQVRGKKLTF